MVLGEERAGILGTVILHDSGVISRERGVVSEAGEVGGG